jgi:hypothetical protein
MPDRVIKCVNVIGLCEKQGRTFWFLNRRQEPYEWMDTVPEDDPKFQGLLKDEEEAAYPDISAELPGVELKSKEVNYAAVTDNPVPDFKQLAATALCRHRSARLPSRHSGGSRKDWANFG